MKPSVTNTFIAILLALAACSSDKDRVASTPQLLEVKLDASKPSYKDLFHRIELIQLESDPQSLIGYMDKAMCIGDSIIILDMSRSSVFLFSPEGRFMNAIGQRGDGPEEYLMCYDIAYNSTTSNISILEPRGTICDYSLSGNFIEKQKLPSKPNYMACDWFNADNMILWSAVNEDECGVSIVDLKSGKTVLEDWKRDRMLDMQRLKPFYQYRGEVKFCPPMTNDVYAVGDTCLRLDYVWKFYPDNITEEYLNEITTIENSSEKNKRLINDLKNGILKNVPSFNGETSLYYYVALQSGIGEEARYLSVFHCKANNKNIVLNELKEGISMHPLFMNDDFMLCQVPYDEVDVYNKLFGLHLTCEEDENPLLAKFYFKK